MSLARLSALAAALLIAALAATAQPKPAPAVDPLVGVWQVETGRFLGDCQITGTIVFKPTDKPNQFTCRLRATQSCNGVFDASAEQSCTVQRQGDRVKIISKIAKSTSSAYAPDHFQMRLVSPLLMTGHQWDDYSARRPDGTVEPLPATFTRRPNPIS
jgi:hypothetical protein